MLTIDGIKARLGPIYDQVTQEDKDLIEAVLKDSAKIVGKSISKGPEYFEREMRHIQATLLNVSARYAEAVQHAFWQEVTKVLTTVAKTIMKTALL